jgi:hypothetical protein
MKQRVAHRVDYINNAGEHVVRRAEELNISNNNSLSVSL